MSLTIARFSFLVLAIGACSSIGAPARVAAQGQPPTIEGLAITPLDPAVEQTVLRARRSPRDLGASISALTRMGEFQRVSELLESIEKRGYNEQQKTAVAAQISSAQRLRIVSHEDVSAAATTALDELFEILGKSLQAPARLGKAIESLTSSDADKVLPAMRTLFAGGEASTAALVNAVVSTADAHHRDAYLRAMLRIDEAAGVEALRQLALYGTPTVRAGALTALIRLSPRDLVEHKQSFIAIVTALYRHGEQQDAATPDSLIAKNAILARGDQLPSRSEVTELLRERLGEHNRIARESVREFGRTLTWTVNPKREGVVPQRMPGWVLAFRDAADAASRLTAIGDNAAESLSAQLTALLAYNVVNDPDWGDAAQVEAFRSAELLPSLASVPGLSEAEFILAGLRLASESENAPAMIGWLRLIEASANAPPVTWLASAGRHVSALVAATDHPTAMVRYEAAAAIARLNPQHPYAGSGRVRQRWQQMSVPPERATAIVLENRPEVISEMETLIRQAGFQARFVSSVSQLEAYASLGEDLRLILCKREPRDASALEMVDIVRRIRVARDVPIVIYTDPPPRMVDGLETAVEDTSELSADELQAMADEAAVMPDEYGVIGGIDNIEGIVHRDLLYGDLDVDSSVRASFDLPWVAAQRWRDESLRAGLIVELVRPRSVAGLYEVLLQSRRHQHLPPLTPVDRNRFREIAIEALAEKQ